MKKAYIETYGCQMNQADSEVVASILKNDNYEITTDIAEADLILVNTCSIRENAEQRVKKRLMEFDSLRKKKSWLKVGVLGCMAERLQNQLVEENKVDIVVGPDSYRDIPSLLKEAEKNNKSYISAILSEEETYADITPVKLDTNGVTAFISIMRGCENFCSYCVVPYTRGRERSRDPQTIIAEAKDLFEKGYREVTLLGQNVNSYIWNKGQENEINFAKLMALVAKVSPLLRIRFSTSHPKDISQELLDTIAKYDNICKFIHLPLQSGSTRMLKIMNRKYTREDYMTKITAIKNTIKDCGISTDIIAGFCTETIEDHKDTLDMMQWVGYDSAFMFNYSQRSNTLAAKKYEDDIPYEEKTRRLEEIIELQRRLSLESNQKDVGKTFEVLIEGESKRSKEQLFGRNTQNKVIIFDRKDFKIGEYVQVKVTSCTSATLFGETI
ncbi:MAG: tRNA (N6-isopentenyl adenosine(37)-C2)-methylthiotransferase MiaB [Bacteroidales bacterium]|jgi:tRNA-2-methylthio-N6-dimethylallyladenosine synthase|nr:tRNA (N6-isopentenyl adenosine(37)-C2)-methylthiotransferase MiaB [Bacteroidales bacterium]MBQ5891155.1 tRNA (N6-isopentenyl adenosine(37)-C2)-methylthiotransferase MiaB [Bacteroidales bacterium]MEE0883224.1 tRNA (N6-isopentenyl adenosine(37)-C2)-methylthiotransferase MiaB [Bacteroidales bacterium]